MEIYEKLTAARQEIKNTKMAKEGNNTFSKYKYFTPSQIEKLVDTACNNHKLVTKFDLKRNELGETGFLTVIDIESGDSIVYEMATAIPSIKATNIAQQLGGCVTYTERYLKTSAFGIVDNSLDFDTTQNTKSAQKQKTPVTMTTELINEITNCTSLTALQHIWDTNGALHKDKSFVDLKNAKKDALK